MEAADRTWSEPLLGGCLFNKSTSLGGERDAHSPLTASTAAASAFDDALAADDAPLSEVAAAKEKERAAIVNGKRTFCLVALSTVLVLVVVIVALIVTGRTRRLLR
jgi:hypothetical protein